MSTILCVDDEPSVGAVLEHALTKIGHQPVLVTSVAEGMKALGSQPVDLIIADYRMPDATGLDLLRQVREQGLQIPVIIMTGYSSIEHAVVSIRHGAVDYLSKPLRAEALRIAVNNAIEVDRLRRANEDYKREISELRGARVIVGESKALREVMETIATVAGTRATVLLEGESGTGKELFARADRKSTRLNSSHSSISYADFCLKKKKPTDPHSVPQWRFRARPPVPPSLAAPRSAHPSAGPSLRSSPSLRAAASPSRPPAPPHPS